MHLGWRATSCSKLPAKRSRSKKINVFSSGRMNTWTPWRSIHALRCFKRVEVAIEGLCTTARFSAVRTLTCHACVSGNSATNMCTNQGAPATNRLDAMLLTWWHNDKETRNLAQLLSLLRLSTWVNGWDYQHESMAMIRMVISPCHRWSSWLTMQHYCIAARCHIRQLSWVKAADSASSETKNKAQQCTATGECRSMACLYKYIVTACTPPTHTYHRNKETNKQANKQTYIHTYMHAYIRT